MKTKFPMKDIAFQAGLSLATVDRALHGRGAVRAVTVARVRAAIAELERHYSESDLSGRRFAIDVVMEAPARFSKAVRTAFEAELPALRPAAFTARFHIAERMTQEDLTGVLRAIRKRGSHGVILKSPARGQVTDLAVMLMEAGIPVLTYVTDLPRAARLAYVGLDNRAAGGSAAWLIGQIIQNTPCRTLLTLSSSSFEGEGAREAGFRAAFQAHFPDLPIAVVSEGHGVDRSTYELVSGALDQHADIGAVYSIGGGNRAILQAFSDHRRECRAFAAHDLDRANRELLAARRLSFVIHHDLRHDARTACQMFLRHHGMLPDEFEAVASRIAIATPFDVDP
jgi:LacI family transcriptional regulator